jgi:hypothetical protein
MMKIKMSDIKVRKSWGDTSPVTKRIDSRKVYSRRNKWGNKFSDN